MQRRLVVLHQRPDTDGGCPRSGRIERVGACPSFESQCAIRRVATDAPRSLGMQPSAPTSAALRASGSAPIAE